MRNGALCCERIAQPNPLDLELPFLVGHVADRAGSKFRGDKRSLTKYTREGETMAIETGVLATRDALFTQVASYISTERLARWSASHAEPMTLEDAYDIAALDAPCELLDEAAAAINAALPNTT
jgi:hypothetical protein